MGPFCFARWLLLVDAPTDLYTPEERLLQIASVVAYWLIAAAIVGWWRLRETSPRACAHAVVVRGRLHADASAVRNEYPAAHPADGPALVHAGGGRKIKPGMGLGLPCFLTCFRFGISNLQRKSAGEPVSRILFAAPIPPGKTPGFTELSAAIIPLGPESLRDSSSLPEGNSISLLEAKRPSFAEANSGQAYGPGRPSPPIWPCSTRGFPCPECCHPGGGLLPHLFTLAKCARPKEAGFRFFRKPAAEVQASPAV